MRKKNAMARRFTGLVLLATVELAAAGALFAVSVPPAAAQWGFPFFGDRQPRRQTSPNGWPWQQEPRREAPATTHVLVLGDSMADWLGYGLEDAFSETPEIGVIRKPRANRGLIKTEGRDPYDAVAAVRET